MLVVSNTSPLSNLAIIGRLDLLREQLVMVNIPPAVRDELGRHPNPSARERLNRAMQDGWLCVVPLVNPLPADLALGLHIGEAETLALALEKKATLVLLDESAARRKAHQLGLTHTGVLGVLLKARQTGRIHSLREEILRLQRDARFFVHPTLEKQLLVDVGEE